MSGLGNGPNGPANTSVVQFTGDAFSLNKLAKGASIMLLVMLLVAIASIVMILFS